MKREWKMFQAVISKSRNPDAKYQNTVFRLHCMGGSFPYESFGFVEQRYLEPITHNEAEAHYFVTCLEHGDGEPIRVNTLEDGMNLLTLMINQGEHRAN